jgi:glycosyltransferase involved in cell wall biosynthesis
MLCLRISAPYDFNTAQFNGNNDGMIRQSLRVLHVLEATLGGTRRYLEDIAQATEGGPIAHGLVYGTSRADTAFSTFLQHAHALGWYLRSADAMRRAIRPLADGQSVLTVSRAIREFRPTIVHAHSAIGGAVARIAASLSWPVAPPVVYSPHALPFRLGAAYMLAERTLAPLTKRFIAVSDSERREIITTKLAEGTRVDVVHPRIDTQRYAPRSRPAARLALGLPDIPVIVGVGRLSAQKDPLSFLQILARVRRSHRRTIGIWVGDGDLRAEAEKLAAHLGLAEAFRITGWTTDVRPYIAASDMLLSTSRYESFGYVIPETLSMERPVVASRVTGTIDVVDSDVQSMLFGTAEIAEAAALVNMLIADRELAARLARHGRSSVVQKFAMSTMRSALMSSYDKAVA